MWSLALAVLAGCSRSAPEESDASKKFIEAQQFLAKGDNDQALAALNDSIAAEPTAWAYSARAKVNALLGNDEAAREDCEAALKLAPDDPDIAWIQGELAKPVAQRFQGNFKTPPSSNR
jgi:Tfp pilus assembly protein PilF